jgi:hypothetical protein
MKSVTLSLFLAFSLPGMAFAYEAPSDAQIQKVLADPSSIDALIEGASPAEAAAVLAAVLEKLDGQNLTPEQKRDFTALLVARVMNIYPKKIKLTMELIGLVNDEWVDVVIAAAYSATGLDVEFKKALFGKSPRAIGNPELTLGVLLYTRILGSVGINPFPPFNPLPPPPLTDGVVDSVPPAAKKYQN